MNYIANKRIIFLFKEYYTLNKNTYSKSEDDR